MSQLAKSTRGSQYTDVDRRNAVTQYVLLGNMERVSENLGIPGETLSHWKCNTEWWVDLVAKIRDEKQDEIDATFSDIIQSAASNIVERINNGDEQVTKDGDIVRKAMSGRDLATVMGITFDKRQVVRMLPTSIRAESTDSRLNALADKVRELQGGMNVIEQPKDTAS